jgi:hypothetical protein
MINQEMDNRHGEAASWRQLGKIELRVDNIEAARALTQRALTLSQEIGEPYGEAASKQLLDELTGPSADNRSWLKVGTRWVE